MDRFNSQRPPLIFIQNCGVGVATLSGGSPGTTVELSERDSRHLVTVLRRSVGTPVTIACRTTGRCFEAELTELGPPTTATLLQEISTSDERVESPVASIICALAKGDHNDLVCEKACELGVSQIVFWQAERSVRLIKSEAAGQKKLDRWNRIAEAAAKQSGRLTIPELHLTTKQAQLAELLETIIGPEDPKFICALTDDAEPVRNLRLQQPNAHLLIGPEGDFTPEEQHWFRSIGFSPIRLGPNVLRTETAAIAAIAMVSARFCR